MAAGQNKGVAKEFPCRHRLTETADAVSMNMEVHLYFTCIYRLVTS